MFFRSLFIWINYKQEFTKVCEIYKILIFRDINHIKKSFISILA